MDKQKSLTISAKFSLLVESNFNNTNVNNNFDFTVRMKPDIDGVLIDTVELQQVFYKLGCAKNWTYLSKLMMTTANYVIPDFLTMDIGKANALTHVQYSVNSYLNLKKLLSVGLAQNSREQILELVSTVFGSENYNQKPIMVSLSFDDDCNGGPVTVRLYVPISAYFKNVSKPVDKLKQKYPTYKEELTKMEQLASQLNCTIQDIVFEFNRTSPSGFSYTLSTPSATDVAIQKIEENEIFLQPYICKTIEPIFMSTKKERMIWIREAKFNLFKLKYNEITLDFLTDSGTGAMSSAQTACLLTGDERYAGSSSYYNFKKTVEDLVGYKYNLPVHQGRAAERLLYCALRSKGKIVPSNGHFDTSRANIEYVGLKAVNLQVCNDGCNDDANISFLGNMDIVGLDELLSSKESANSVAFVTLSITNNLAGGQPVSMENIKSVRKLCTKYGKMLIFDGCRMVENSCFIKMREDGYKNKSIHAIIREMMSFGDGMIMSAKKDGLCHIGGWVSMNDQDIFEAVEEMLILTEGYSTYGGLAGRDLDCIAQGLKEVVQENYIMNRIKSITTLGKILKNVSVPVEEPFGGHAIYVDASKFIPLVPMEHYPAHALAIALYIESGIRTVSLGSLEFGSGAKELLRIAVPRRTYSDTHYAYLAQAFKKLVNKKHNIIGMKIVKATGLMRHFTAELDYINEIRVDNSVNYTC